jgi:hypothetical protein
MIDLTTLEQDRDYQATGRQRSARTDPSMRDGDSGHGNPYEYDPGDGEPSTDTDVGDEVDETADELIAFAGTGGGAVGGTPAGKRAEGGTMPEGEPLGTGIDARDGSTIGLPDPSTRTPPPVGPTDDMPIPGYPNLSVPEIISQLAAMPREQLERVQQYESKHRKRKTLLTKLNRILRDAGSST